MRTRERVGNFLLYGFAISIVLHLLIGPLVKFDRTQPEEEKVSVIKRDRMPTPPPTPPPTPKPTPTPPPTPPPTQPPKTPPPVKHTPVPEKPKIKINTAKTTASKGGATEAANTHTEGSTNGIPQGTSTATAATPVPVQTAAPAPPTVAPTKPPSCANPNVQATTTNAVAPDTPPIAQQQGITGVVNVVISLDAESHIVGTPTVQSSPSQLLNAAAIKAAEQSTFRTEIKDCQPIAATYIFAVEFNNN